MGGAEEMEEVNGAGAPSNGDANGSAPEGAAQPDPLEAGQPAARKRSRWAAGEEGAAEGAAEGVAEVVEEAPKKRKSKVLSPHRSVEALLRDHRVFGADLWRCLLLLFPCLFYEWTW